MLRKVINILRQFVHQVGSIHKIIQGCTVNKTFKKKKQTKTKNQHFWLYFPPKFLVCLCSAQLFLLECTCKKICCMTCPTEVSALFSAVTCAYEVLDVLSHKIHKSQAVEKSILDFIKKYFWCTDYLNISCKCINWRWLR